MMQRLQLHFRGIELPPLGSMRDRVFREALDREKTLEAKKTEFLMLLTAVSKQTTDPGAYREWVSSVKKVWRGYVGMLMNVDLPEHDADEETMLKYYQEVIKHTKPKAKKTSKGTIEVSGLDVMRK